MSRIELSIALFALIAADAAGAATITNGDFEAPGTFHGSFQTLSAGSTALTGWAIGGSVDLINTYWAPDSGAYSLDMSGNGAGSISQMLTGLSIGSTYQLSFDLAGNPAGTQGVKSLTASVGDLAKTVTFNTAGKTTGAMGWQTVNLSFKATTTNALLTLQSNTASAMGPALDNVSLAKVAAPSPGALLMAPPPPPGIVANGSFEQAGGFSGGFTTLGAGSTVMPGWKVTSGSVDLLNAYGQAADGGYSLDMSGNTADRAGGGQEISADVRSGLEPDRARGRQDADGIGRRHVGAVRLRSGGPHHHRYGLADRKTAVHRDRADHAAAIRQWQQLRLGPGA